MGGERPKIATFVDEAGAPSGTAPKPVLLKFALPSERPDSVLAEATALSLAQQLGMNVPGHGVRWFNDAPALCIDRFDRAPLHHCVSAATALDLVPGSDVEDRKRSYVQLRSKLKHTHDPLELFKRIVFNAVVGNTDDHPWNTSLRQVGLGDWALSPLYDVMPFFARSHRPAFRMAITRAHGQAATLANLVQAGHQIAQLHEDQVRALIEQVNTHVHAHWRATFEQHAQGAPHSTARSTVHEWPNVFECVWLA